MIRNLIGEAVGLVFTWVAAVAGLVLLGYGVSQIVVWARSAWPVILDIFVFSGIFLLFAFACYCLVIGVIGFRAKYMNRPIPKWLAR